MKKAPLAIGVIAGLVVGGALTPLHAEDFDSGQVCNDGANAAKFALEDHQKVEALYQEANDALAQNARNHEGRPTRNAVDEWKTLSARADYKVSNITRVGVIADDLSWCSAG